MLKSFLKYWQNVRLALKDTLEQQNGFAIKCLAFTWKVANLTPQNMSVNERLCLSILI